MVFKKKKKEKDVPTAQAVVEEVEKKQDTPTEKKTGESLRIVTREQYLDAQIMELKEFQFFAIEKLDQVLTKIEEIKKLAEE
jgi:hypothetical protein